MELAYDGAGFAGWASQPRQRTVQGVLESSIAGILRLDPPPRMTVAGRTDSGVHATGQVAHVDLPAGVDADRLADRLSRLLPPDVRVHRVDVAPAGFDARFSALSRRYTYRVCDAPYGVPPLRRHDTVAHPRPLDLDRMTAAAGLLLGEHDFAAYCRARRGATTIRRLDELSWRRGDDGITLGTVVADAFCHSMVRAIVGALLPVGDGRRPTDWPRRVLDARERDPAVMVAPAHGLTLVAVDYPPDAELAARAAQTRRPRVASSAG